MQTGQMQLGILWVTSVISSAELKPLSRADFLEYLRGKVKSVYFCLCCLKSSLKVMIAA